MPTYTPSDYATLALDADVVQNKTNAYKIIPISDDVDLGYFWQKSGLVLDSTNFKLTYVKPGGTTINRSDTGAMQLVNTNPQLVKVLILGVTLTDIDFIGNLLIYPEFKINTSWVQADRVVVPVIDDPIAG